MSALVSYLFRRSIAPAGCGVPAALSRKASAFAVRAILKVADPLVQVRLGKKTVAMHLSHELPRLMARHPHYDTALPRLCRFLHERRGELVVIDVGANVGDTVSLVAQEVQGQFLCVEGDPSYFAVLQENTRGMRGVTCENVLLSDAVGSSGGTFVKVGGTAHLSAGDGAAGASPTTTVDSLVQRHPAFAGTHVLKVDTDGYDYKILRGAAGLIKSARPAIFFELTPEYLTPQGEDPLSIFPFLKALGYEEVLVYDNCGYPVMRVASDDRERLAQLIDYATFRPDLYFDVLAFHASQAADAAAFHAGELEHFRSYTAQ